MEPTFRTIPVLRIFDVAKAKEFYVGFLGFQIDWEHRFETDAPVYMQIARGDLVLHLSEHHGDCCPGGCVYVRTTTLDALHREITAKGYRYLRPGIEPTPWGSRLMEVTDRSATGFALTRSPRRAIADPATRHESPERAFMDRAGTGRCVDCRVKPGNDRPVTSCGRLDRSRR